MIRWVLAPKALRLRRRSAWACRACSAWAWRDCSAAARRAHFAVRGAARQAGPGSGESPGKPRGAREPVEKVPPVERPVQKPPMNVDRATLPPLGDGPLSGFWQTQAGAQFRISDDKKGISVDGMQSSILQAFTGKLTRASTRPEEKILTGTFDATFTADGRTYSIDVTITAVNPSTMSVRCTNWPKFNGQGRFLGKDVLSITWFRVPDASSLAPGSPEGPARLCPRRSGRNRRRSRRLDLCSLNFLSRRSGRYS